MQNSKAASAPYVPELIHNQISLIEDADLIETAIDSVAEEIALSIIDGWSSGNKSLDFSLVVNDGYWDKELYESYDKCSLYGLMFPMQHAVAIQWSLTGNKVIESVLKTVHLFTLRRDDVKFDIDNLCIEIPVNPGFFTWQEIFFENGQQGGKGHLQGESWLRIGALNLGEYQIPKAVKLESGLIVTPDTAPADFFVLSEVEFQSIEEKFEIDPDELTFIKQKWIAEKSSQH